MKITLEINVNAIKQAFSTIQHSVSIKTDKEQSKSNIAQICDRCKDAFNNAHKKLNKIMGE